MGGNVVAPILSKTLPNLVTLRPGLLTPAVLDPGATAVVESLSAEPFQAADVRLINEEYQEDTEGRDLARARVVIGLGMGVGEEEVSGLVDLARSLGASVATTRDVVTRRLAASAAAGGHQWTNHSTHGLHRRGDSRGVQPHRRPAEDRNHRGRKPEPPGDHLPFRGLRCDRHLAGVSTAPHRGVAAGALPSDRELRMV